MKISCSLLFFIVSNGSYAMIGIHEDPNATLSIDKISIKTYDACDFRDELAIQNIELESFVKKRKSSDTELPNARKRQKTFVQQHKDYRTAIFSRSNKWSIQVLPSLKLVNKLVKSFAEEIFRPKQVSLLAVSDDEETQEKLRWIPIFDNGTTEEIVGMEQGYLEEKSLDHQIYAISHCFMLTNNDGQVIAAILFSLNPNRTKCYLDAIGINEDMQNRGLGSALMKLMYAIAALYGCPTIHLLPVYTPHTLRFYFKFGFSLHGIDLLLSSTDAASKSDEDIIKIAEDSNAKAVLHLDSSVLAQAIGIDLYKNNLRYLQTAFLHHETLMNLYNKPRLWLSRDEFQHNLATMVGELSDIEVTGKAQRFFVSSLP